MANRGFLVFLFFGACIFWIFNPKKGFKYHFHLYEGDKRVRPTIIVGFVFLLIAARIFLGAFSASESLDPLMLNKQ